MEGVVVIKLGGSVLTDKQRPHSVRRKALESISESISLYNGRLILVHGGGSFGHPIAMRYRLSSMKYTKSGNGIFETRQSMQQLSSLISQRLRRHGVKTYTLPAVSLLNLEGGARENLVSLLESILVYGLVPLTYGDVAVFKQGFKIVSGDYLSYILSTAIKAEKMIFLIDKPGILADLNNPDSVVQELEYKKLNQFVLSEERDATGGFRAKLYYARKIAEKGIDVLFLSGLDKDALIRSLHGERGAGTLVRGKK